jgi:hypothetical protein
VKHVLHPPAASRSSLASTEPAGAPQPLLVKSADCVVTTTPAADSTLAIALGAGLGVGIPVIAIAAYFLFFRKGGTTSPSNAVP